MSRILIVEDEEAIAELEKDYLELSDFEVTTVKNGMEALELGRIHDYDMYILDIMVPGMDGIELCRELRKISNVLKC